MKVIVELSLPGNRQSLLGQIQLPKENPWACGRIGSPDPVPGSLGSAWVSHVEEDVTLQVLHEFQKWEIMLRSREADYRSHRYSRISAPYPTLSDSVGTGMSPGVSLALIKQVAEEKTLQT